MPRIRARVMLLVRLLSWVSYIVVGYCLWLGIGYWDKLLIMVRARVFVRVGLGLGLGYYWLGLGYCLGL